MSLSATGLSPAFASATLSYTLAVAHSVASLSLVPTLSNNGVSVQVNGTAVASGASTAVTLAVGSTTLSIVVTAADGSTRRTYTVVVTRAAAAASTDAGLASLVLSSGTLSPGFATGTTAYIASVAQATATVTLTPTASQASARITVNGATVASGTASAALALAVGVNVLHVVVTAEDGVSTRTYTLTVTRAAASVSSDASLAALVVSSGTLMPTFASGTRSYTLAVPNSTASLTVTPTASSAAARLTLNGGAVTNGSVSAAAALAVGNTVLTLVVTAEDGSTTQTTTITVTRAAAAVSSDASLAGLVLSQGSLTPSFASATTSYAVTVANTVTALTVTPTAGSSTASIRINGSVVASGAASASLALAVGGNTLSIVVTAEDGTTTRTYTLAVTRSATGSCVLTPTETQGPYPLLAILSNSAMVRSDITEGKAGVPLTLKLRILDQSTGCAPVAGAAVYIWHCDKDGLYSGYSASNNAGQAGLTYLRGIQVTDASGEVTFTTIYPGWYAGRITHIHFQVYLNNNLQVTATATSQLGFAQTVTQAVYASALYTKGQNTSVTSFAADNVFSDGTTYQLAAVTGTVSAGYAATLEVTIA